MELDQIIFTASYDPKVLLEIHQLYNKHLNNALEITNRNYFELIKIIKADEYKDDMNLKGIVDDLLKVYDDAKDVWTFVKAKSYYIDGEKYRGMGEDHTYKYLKRKCVEKFEKIRDPELIQKFKEEMGSYLPKKYQ